MKHVLCVISDTDRSTLADDLYLIKAATDAGYIVSVVMLHDDTGIRDALRNRVSYFILANQGIQFSPLQRHDRQFLNRPETKFNLRRRYSYNTSTNSFKLILQKIQPDIVFVNSTNMLACANAAGNIGIPAMLRVNYALSDEPAGIRRFWLRNQINRHSVRIIARSRIDSTQLLQSPRIRVVHDGISPDLIDSCTDIVLGPMIEPPLIAYFHQEPKDDYRAIWDHLAYRFPSRQMAVLSPMVDIGGLAINNDLSCESVRVRITGCLADRNNKTVVSDQQIPRSAILKKADLLIMPTITKEGLPIVLTAGYLKIPVISFDQVLAHDYVTDGFNGCLVSGDSVIHLIDKTTMLLNDLDRLARLGATARNHVLMNHNRDTNVNTLLAIFREIL